VDGPHGQRRGGAVAIVSPEEAFPGAGFHGQRRGGAAATPPEHGQHLASQGHFILFCRVAGPLFKAPFHRRRLLL